MISEISCDTEDWSNDAEKFSFAWKKTNYFFFMKEKQLF